MRGSGFARLTSEETDYQVHDQIQVILLNKQFPGPRPGIAQDRSLVPRPKVGDEIDQVSVQPVPRPKVRPQLGDLFRGVA